MAKAKNKMEPFRAKHLKKSVLEPLRRLIESNARDAKQQNAKLMNRLQRIEDLLDILAAEFLRWTENNKG